MSMYPDAEHWAAVIRTQLAEKRGSGVVRIEHPLQPAGRLTPLMMKHWLRDQLVPLLGKTQIIINPAEPHCVNIVVFATAYTGRVEWHIYKTWT